MRTIQEDVRAAVAGPESRRGTAPLFIVGCSRSGTTLLQTLVDSQPNVAIPPESHIYARFGSIFHTYGDLTVRQNRLRLIEDLLGDALIRRWRLDATTLDLEQRIAKHTVGGVIEALFSLYAEMQGATRWGDKTPEHIRHLREIRRDFPDAILIHLVRDGRDVAEAMRRMVFGPVTALGLAREWRRQVMHWQAFCRYAGTDRTLLVRYEKLVTAPQDVIGDVLTLMNETWSDTTSTYMDSALSQKMGAAGPWQSSLRRGISANKIGIYRRKFTESEIETFESVAGDALAAFGYEIDHGAPRAPTLYDRQQAFASDRFVRWYRKLHHPRVFWIDLQFRARIAYRLLRSREPRQIAN